MLIRSEEAGTKLETPAVASSIVVHSGPAPLKGAPPAKTLTAELVFDTSKEGTDVRKRIAALNALAVVDGTKKRPPAATVIWGSALPVFEGVIESVRARYTLFLADGTPTRASVSVGAREAQRCLRDSMCPTGQFCRAGRCADPPAPSTPLTQVAPQAPPSSSSAP